MRTHVVSGTASGLGRALRTRLERAGDRVIGIDRHATGHEEVVADLGSRAGREAALRAVRELSGGAIDGLVSCAGLGPYDEPEAVVRVTGSTSQIVFEALPVDDPQVRQPDITRARQLLGWEPEIGLEDGLRRTLGSLRPDTAVA